MYFDVSKNEIRACKVREEEVFWMNIQYTYIELSEEEENKKMQRCREEKNNNKKRIKVKWVDRWFLNEPSKIKLN